MDRSTLGRFTKITAVVSLVVILLVINVVQYSKNNSINELNEDINKRLQLSEDEQNTLMNEKAATEKELLKVKLENDKLRSEITDLNTDIENLEILDSASIQELSWVGIDDSEDIITDLYEHPELIPFDGVLGGTMFFYKATVINYKWVYAHFEDGHIHGVGLYEFEVDHNNQITWKLIDAFLSGD
ncbi:hypothetical protein [Chengkuizengella sediminis]|uniref:hypothetical protein n=1 Tax=Chengkuizengella sediminis TaxID=1885917 RepID=UPI001389F5D0|nr:hypothetical protein [Chengkuizengella sediminis]NDI35699.1 hypothetical protein [Chengkuizengella sediminis]